jgi:5-methylcytosine-specific restriction protein B
MKNWEVVQLNRALQQALRAIPDLSTWTTNEIERFLYAWADPRETRRVVKIAPGESAKYWSDCLANEYICVGWDDVGDLREFESQEEFRDAFYRVFAELHNNHKPTLRKKSNEVWTLAELEPGDVIIANQGTSKVLAVGTVVEPGYEWRPERAEYRHTVRVKWDTAYGQEIEPQKKWATTTVAPVPAELYQQILNKLPLKSDTSKLVAIPVEPVFLEIAAALERKGQAVLYGPPGTGKTYQARRFALWWLLQSQGDSKAQSILTDDQARAAAERRLTTTQVTRRVWWFVANPKE